MRAGVDVVYQGVFVDERLARCRRLPGARRRRRRRSGAGATRRSTRSSPAAKPAYILQLCFYNEQLGRIQGRRRSRSMCCSAPARLRASGPQEFGAYYRRVRSRLERVRRREPRRPSRARTTTAGSATSSRSATRSGTRSTTSAGSPASSGAQIERLARRRDHDARRPRRAPAEPSPPGMAPETFAKIREQAALQLWAREHGRDRYVLLPPQAGARVRAAARALAGRPLLRLRGQPVLGQGRQPRVPVGDPRRRPELHAALGVRPRDASGRRSSSSSTSCMSGCARTRPARLPLRRLRDHRAQAADGPLRHARGRARRPAAPRRLRRPATRSSATACAPRGPATG